MENDWTRVHPGMLDLFSACKPESPKADPASRQFPVT